MNKALDLLHGLVSEVERKTCCHEETHRGGAIWEICDSCGAKWADDEGGKPEFAWPESVEKAREFLATHPAVEQACWDERKLSDLGNELHNLSCSIVHENEKLAEQIGGIARELWNWPQARAALAQPSPAQAEQAEAERPEVVARVVHSNPVVLGQCGPLNANDELMTVAQHAASVARWAEMFNRVEQERDAALARVAELENGTVYVEARQCYECHHGGINDSADGLAACHDCDWTGPEPDEDKCPGCHRENCMAAACPECGGRYELVADANIAAPPAQAQHLHDLDKQCRDDVARALGLRPNEERGFAWSYLLASIKSCVKAAEDTAQAQHSVLELEQSRSALTEAQMRRIYENSTEAENERLGFAAFARLMRRAEAVHQIAAAPGKEVGHE
ncbi:TPA: hypothetical protein L3939_006562 [Pseudomonas aeruginosa]|nr:hypothetical protein [Pseudomonas aeruginosa]HBN9723528.1 hypothetical protein [Pseudomonas aeruginosa]HBN9771707.1 hypothetical protein [Pseudomonas aeruginosa]HBN9893450.1 hypothetical protein [Pseudomonas aeruginosa]